MDSFTEVDHDGLGERAGNACCAFIMAPVLVVIGIGVLIYNEANAVAHHRSLDQGEKNTIEVFNISSINPANEGKLIHVTGDVTTTDTVVDDVFGVGAAPNEVLLKLERSVEMYQWKEEQRSETKKNTGGSTTTTTTYSYSQGWYNYLIDSSTFNKQDAKYKNPTSFPYPGKTFTADPILFGAFELPEEVSNRINWLSSYKGALNVSSIPDNTLRNKTVIDNSGMFYIGENPQSAQTGDIRIRYESLTAPQTVSIIAEQRSNTLVSWSANAGRDILLVVEGVQSPETMYDDAHDAVTTLAWIFRFVGFVLIYFGLIFAIEPLTTFADIIPCIGDFVESCAHLIMMPIAAFIAIIIIGIAWLAVRPLFVIPMLIAIGASLFFCYRRNEQLSEIKPPADNAPTPVTAQVVEEAEPDIKV